MAQTKALAGILPADVPVKDKALALDASRWGRNFEWRQLAALAVYFEQYELEKDTVIIGEGSTTRLLGVIVSGKLVVEKETGDGNRNVLAELRQGRAIGEISMIDGYPASATVRTGADTTLLVLWSERFEMLRKEQPALAGELLFKIAQTLSARLRRTSGMLIGSLEAE